MNAKRERYRSNEQVVVVVAFATGILIVGIATAHQAASSGQEVFQIGATVLTVVAITIVPLRTGLLAR